MSKQVNAKQAPSTDSLTAVSMAVAICLKPMQVVAAAEKALDRKRGAQWLAVIDASACFDGTMTEKDRTALSGELARNYARFYAGDSAKVAASQHAKAIHAIATGAKAANGKALDPRDFKSMKDFFAAIKPPRQQADAGNDARPGTTTDAANDAATQANTDAANDAANRPATAFDTAGLSVEVGGAIVRLIEAARKSSEVADAVLFMANSPERMVEFVSHVLAQRLGAKFGADKVKVAKAA